MWRRNPQQGAVVIEERDGQGWAIAITFAGIGATALGIALAFAVVQLSTALAWAIGALGAGGGVMLACRGAAFIIEARGRAKAEMIRAQGERMFYTAQARQLTSGTRIAEDADAGGSAVHH